MTGVTAVVLDVAAPVRIGGLPLAERGRRLAARIGLAPIHVAAPGSAPVAEVGRDEHVVIIGPSVLAEPKALAGLVADLRQGDGQSALALSEAGEEPLLVALPAGLVDGVRDCRSIEAIASSLGARGLIVPWAAAGRFCQRVHAADSARAERAYLRHTNGRESFFTKKIRRFSVPLSGHLARLGFSPTMVTASGLVIAILSAWCLSTGHYLLGVLGGVLYYTSMVFDCSDGEVARLTLTDSPFGAWLETMVDYSTYFFVLAGVTWASAQLPYGDVHRMAAGIALVGSVVVVIVASYLRHRVAAADPGQFDEASSRTLKKAGGIHGFAKWGRQWIKRSTIAHLVVVLALIDQMQALLYLWAFGATLASVTILVVAPFVVRRVHVTPVGAPPGGVKP
jgi:phosphatidylglycerophosphate synthase